MPIRSGTSVPDCITANENLLARLRFTGSSGKIEIYWLKKCIGGQRPRKVMKAGTKERDVVQLPAHKRVLESRSEIAK